MQLLVVRMSSQLTSTQLEITCSESAVKKLKQLLWKSLTSNVYLFIEMKLKIYAKIFHSFFSILITLSPPSMELKDSL